MMNPKRGAIWFLCVVLTTGSLACRRPPPALPALPADALAVPLNRQATPYSCGPASLLAILRYMGLADGPEDKLYGPLGTTPEYGTLPEKLAEVAQGMGLSAVAKQHMTLDELRQDVRAGKPVIVEMQAWPTEKNLGHDWNTMWDEGHYVDLIGMDDSYAYFMDPAIGDAYTYLPLAELPPRWHDLNPSRPVKDPEQQHDRQLGVVISRQAAQAQAQANNGVTTLTTSRLRKLD